MEARDLDAPLPDWRPPAPPSALCLDGESVRLERLDPARHARDLYEAFRGGDRLWDYMPYGPFADEAAYRTWAEAMAAERDPWFYAIRDRETGQAVGQAAYLRVTPAHGTIEVGHICLAPALQRSRAATEAMILMAEWVFAAGYRRYEWKCNALNLASRRAAERLGFSYEGVFRQHMVIKGKNRDTAWFAMTDGDWPGIKGAYDRWRSPGNFDADGRQRESLSDLTRPLLATRDPGLSHATSPS